MIESLETRIASWSQIPVSHGEPIQVLRYEPGQEYRAHYDYFFHQAGHKNNRIATVLMYLSDVEVRTHITYTGISTCLSSWTLLRACFTRQHLLLIYFLYVDRRVARLSFRTQACPMLVTDHCFRSVETPAKLSNPVKATPFCFGAQRLGGSWMAEAATRAVQWFVVKNGLQLSGCTSRRYLRTTRTTESSMREGRWALKSAGIPTKHVTAGRNKKSAQKILDTCLSLAHYHVPCAMEVGATVRMRSDGNIDFE